MDGPLSSTVAASDDARPASTRSTLASVRLVSICTLLSRVLGLGREMAMAWLFGAGTVSDAFTLAFRIPNVFRQLLGEGALTTAFLPRFVQELEQRGPGEARRLSSGVLFTLAALLVVFVLAAEGAIGLAFLLRTWSERTTLLLQLIAILLPYLLVICLSAQLCAVLQSLRSFFWPAMIPVLLNIAWIASTFVAPWASADSAHRIQLVAGGIVLGGVVQLLIPYLVLAGRGYGLTSDVRSVWPQVRAVFAAMTPVLAGVLLSQASTLMDTSLAWWLADGERAAAGSNSTVATGTAAALYYAYRLLQFPMGVFGVALGTVLFPVLTRSAKREDWTLFRRDYGHGLEMALAIGIPASVALVQLATPLTQVLFERGNFDRQDSALTARMVVGYGVSVWASIAILIVNRGFYAVEDRLTPVRMASIAVVLNLALSLSLVFLVGGDGLAWASSVSAIVQLGLCVWAAATRFGAFEAASIGRTVGKTLAASAGMVVVCHLLSAAFTGPSRMSAAGLATVCAVGGGTYLSIAHLIGLTHPAELLYPRRRGGSQDAEGEDVPVEIV